MFFKYSHKTWTHAASNSKLAVILVTNVEVDASRSPGQQVWLRGLHLCRKAGSLLCLGLVKRLKIGSKFLPKIVPFWHHLDTKFSL